MLPSSPTPAVPGQTAPGTLSGPGMDRRFGSPRESPIAPLGPRFEFLDASFKPVELLVEPIDGRFEFANIGFDAIDLGFDAPGSQGDRVEQVLTSA